MGRYLDRLKLSEQPRVPDQQNPQNSEILGFVGFVGIQPATIKADPARNNAKFWIDVIDVNHIDRREQAEKNCSTCTHVTYRGGCGVPVEAKFSALEGVICYHPTGGLDCPVWKAQGST